MKKEAALERAIHVFRTGRYFPQQDDDLVWITLEKIRRQVLKLNQKSQVYNKRSEVKHYKPAKENPNVKENL